MATITLSLPKGLLVKADRAAQKEDRSRSELMCVALLAYLDRKPVWEKVFAYGDKLAKRKNLKPSEVEAVIAEVHKTR